MNNLIPPEIINDEFSDWIRRVCSDSASATILEIGASSGEGSTQQILEGVSQSETPKTLFCVEFIRERFEQLQQNLKQHDFAHAVHGSTVDLNNHPTRDGVIEFFSSNPTHARNYRVDDFLRWHGEGIDLLKEAAANKMSLDVIGMIQETHGIETFDIVLLDGSEFTGLVELYKVYGAKYILLDDICTYKNAESHWALSDDPNYVLLHENRSLRNGFSVFKRTDDSAPLAKTMPVHFFTIVLNGMPYIEHHVEAFKRLSFNWHWHIIEGVADLVHDTAWGKRNGGGIPEDLHQNGLSMDGTTEYLDGLQEKYPGNITVYRKGGGRFWDGKLEMVNAPLANLPEDALLWQVDSDELWTTAQVHAMSNLFCKDTSRTAAMFWCHYFTGPELVVSTRNCYSQNPNQEWLRCWKYKKGMEWAAHEPPILCVKEEGEDPVNVAGINPYRHKETEAEGLVFQHFAYTTEAQLKFKEEYYGYKDALAHWKQLNVLDQYPAKLKNFFPWVRDETEVDRCESLEVTPLFTKQQIEQSSQPRRTYTAVLDAVFFQYFQTGIARLWESIILEWVRSGFIQDVCILDRDGTAPQIDGANYRRIQRHDYASLQEDRDMLESTCRELGAKVFVSTYYSFPSATPAALLLYDMIPEVFEWKQDAMWAEKVEAVKNASSLLSISENTARDACRFHPGRNVEDVKVAYCATSDHFQPATEQAAKEFQEKYGIRKPYYLLVGSSTGYKNAQLFFEGFAQLEGSEAFDILRTGPAPFDEGMRGYCHGSTVHSLRLSDEELALAYGGAVALVYPSRYEGFGMPPLEAMASGCPVITCRNSSIPEVVGEAAIYVPENDAAAMAKALFTVQDPDERANLIKAGLERPKKFSWERSATLIKESLIEVAMGKNEEVASQTQPVSTVQPKLLDADEIRQLRDSLTEGLLERSYGEVLECLQDGVSYSQLNSNVSHAIEWNEQEQQFVQQALARDKNNAKERTRDYLLLTLYLPHHLIPFTPDLEFMPDSLLSTILSRHLEKIPGFLAQADMNQKSIGLRDSLNYLAQRTTVDPHSEQTSQLAQLVLELGMPAALINQHGDPLQKPLQDRATVFEYVLRQHLNIEDADAPKQGSGRIGILCSHMGQGDASTYAIALLQSLGALGVKCDLVCDSASSSQLQKLAEDLADRTVLLPQGITESSRLIQSLNLDVLIYTDALHNSDSPPFLLAMQRLAPIQVAVASTLTTTGIETIDHIVVGDNWLETQSNGANEFVENVIRAEQLGSAYLVELPPNEENEAPSRDELGLAPDDCLFVSAADVNAITPEVRTTWVQLLAERPGSKLLLVPFTNPYSEEAQRRTIVTLFEMEAEAAGVDKTRLLILTDIVPTIMDAVSYIELGDVYLEAFPCNTPLPAAKAAEAGLPVLTIPGTVLRERITGGILREQALEDLLAADLDDYKAKALQFAEAKPVVKLEGHTLEPLAESIMDLLPKDS